MMKFEEGSINICEHLNISEIKGGVNNVPN